jgi:hypothetical protein
MSDRSANKLSTMQPPVVGEAFLPQLLEFVFVEEEL